MQNEFLRWPRVRQLTGLSRSTVWRLEKNGQFAAATQDTHEVGQ